MENASFIALSMQSALLRKMDVIANNLANMNTTGFKGEKTMFIEHLLQSKGGDSFFGRKLSYVRDIATMLDMSDGPVKETGNPLDIAINGEGFFVVQTGQGERYTRNGRFQLDVEGQLVTQNGDPVLADGGQPLFFGPTDVTIEIARDGTVSTENGTLGRLRVVRFENEQEMQKTGGTLFSTDTTRFPPEDVEQPVVMQGVLESSNVKAILELSAMIKVQRAYDGVRTFIEKEDERMRSMVREMARTA